jgi:tetratricopeptide (TPR) repeat protein
MTKGLVGVIVLGLAVAPAIASAQDAVAVRVQGALDTRMVQAECKLDGGDFRVSSGKTYLKTGIEGSGAPSNRVGALKSGVRVVTEAITTAGQGKSSAAWYWLGRLYLQQGDLTGADSAFTKTVALAPGCEEEIKKYRYRAWAALVNAGGTYRQSKQDDSAMVFYRAANQIFQDPPLAYVSMADIFTVAKQTDSALVYFGRAAQTQPTDTAMIKLRNQAAFNYGVLLLNTGKSREAIAALHQYLALQPNDVAGKKGLAQAFRAAGMADSAQVVERELVAGVGAGAAAAGAEDALSDADLFDLATRQYNDKNYGEAASSYGRLLQRNPNHRDALYAQANSYLALQQGTSLIGAAQKLVALDPLGEYNYQLLAQGYKFEKRQDKLAETIIAEYALPVDLQFGEFVAAADNATFGAKAVGREARDENNKLIPPRPLTITVEFLARDGSVLASQEASIPALKAAESNPVSVQVKATGVSAWRYRVK